MKIASQNNKQRLWEYDVVYDESDIYESIYQDTGKEPETEKFQNQIEYEWEFFENKIQEKIIENDGCHGDSCFWLLTGKFGWRNAEIIPKWIFLQGKGKLNRELMREIFPNCDFSVRISKIENKKRKAFQIEISHHDGRNILYLREIREGLYRKYN